MNFPEILIIFFVVVIFSFMGIQILDPKNNYKNFCLEKGFDNYGGVVLEDFYCVNEEKRCRTNTTVIFSFNCIITDVNMTIFTARNFEDWQGYKKI